MEFWERLLDRYGLPVAFLVVVLVGVYLSVRYIVFPLINRLMTTLEQQLTEARQARREDAEKFLEALERQGEVTGQQTDAIRQLTQRIDSVLTKGRRT